VYFGLLISEALLKKPLESIIRADNKFLRIVLTKLHGVTTHIAVILTFAVFRDSNFNKIFDSTLK